MIRNPRCAAACDKFKTMSISPPSLLISLAILFAMTCTGPARAQQLPGDDIVMQAREALRKKDRNGLATARMAVNSARHPLALWVEYWELTNRLPDAQQSELESFYARWPGSYVEDRLRNDWLLELGRRRDWVNIRTEFPRFRMNDDREVTCYALLAQHLAGQDVKAAARAAWQAQRDLDDGCGLMSRTLVEARVLRSDDIWQTALLALEANRPKSARAAIALIGPAANVAAGEVLENPARYLARQPQVATHSTSELSLLALMRLAATDAEAAASQLEGSWSQAPATGAGCHRLGAYRQAGRHAPSSRWRRPMPGAPGSNGRPPASLGCSPPWTDDLLAWHVRAALRQADGENGRWKLITRAIEAMSANEQRDAAWVYWRARATAALAAPGTEGDAARAASRIALESITTQFNFYGKLALEDLGGRITLPPAPTPISAAEREAASSHRGLSRGLRLIAMGLRSEGVREWNFSLRFLQERELLAAAQLACEREVWDRCINTSDRTRGEIDIWQRFPTPYREQVVATARLTGIDPAVMYGLIRQESRFMTDLRSGVGASGLMQLMPATARWTARQIGMDYRPETINDRDVNLQLGAAYLKRVLDDFGGSLSLAAAAYNAGPGRPRRWREGGALMEPAAWAESIPFNETRDYVKKVLSNSVYYAAVLGATSGTQSASGGAGSLPTLKSRLGPPIGPLTGLRDAGAAAPDRDLPARTAP